MIIVTIDNSVGACLAARAQNSFISSTPEGLFERLQCQELMGGVTSCQCVSPVSGERLPGTSEVVVLAIEDAPNCDARGKHRIKQPIL